jgi:hypothetical protein
MTSTSEEKAGPSFMMLVDHMGIGQPDAPSPSGRFGPSCGQWKLTFVLVLRDDQAPMDADFKKGNQQSATRRRKVGSLSFAIGGDFAGAHPLALL